MKLTYIGMNNGSVHEARRLIEELQITREVIEDRMADGKFAIADRLVKEHEAPVMASLEMVMRCDAVHATTLPQDGQHSYHWHKAMRPYRQAYVAQCQSTRPAADPDDEANEVEQHQAWLIEQGHDYAVFGGVRI